jgi:hypothetical protein
MKSAVVIASPSSKATRHEGMTRRAFVIAVLCACGVVTLLGRAAVTSWYLEVATIGSSLQKAPNVSTVTTYYNADPFPSSIGADLKLTSNGRLNICCFRETSVDVPTRFSISVVGQWDLRVSRRGRDGTRVWGPLEVGPRGLSDDLLGTPVLSVRDATARYDEVQRGIEKWPVSPEYSCKELPSETVCYSRRDDRLKDSRQPWKMPFTD